MDDKLRLEVKEIVDKTVTSKIVLICAIIGPIFGAVVGVCSYAYGSDKDYNAKSDQAMVKAIEDIKTGMSLVVSAVGEIKCIKEDVASIDKRVKYLEIQFNRNVAEED
jgi:hypothetical protein